MYASRKIYVYYYAAIKINMFHTNPSSHQNHNPFLLFSQEDKRQKS